MGKKISVVIPIYNTETLLGECIDSVLAQTYKNLELVLVDDGSTDSSGKICDEYALKDSRVVVIHKENGGNTSARKAGITRATGKYIAFVDSDDWIDKEMYETLLGHALDNEADIVSSGYYINYEKEASVVYDAPEQGIYVSDLNYMALIETLIGSTDGENRRMLSALWCKLFTKDIVCEAMDVVDNSIQYGEDWLCFCDAVLKSKRVYVLKEAFYHYRIRSGSITHSKDPWYFRKMNELYVAFKERISQYPQYSDVLMKQLAYNMAENMIKGINYQFDFGVAVSMPCYRLPVELLGTAKKVVLFGAGKMGRYYYREIMRNPAYELAGWLDSNYKNCLEEGLPVQRVESITELSYDVILLGAMYRGIADSMRQTLRSLAVPEEKIVWCEPQSFIELEEA